MKKIKSNTLMMLLFGICAIFGMSVVKADEAFKISNTLSVVCNPEIIKNGEQTKCYIVTLPDEAALTDPNSASVHGFVTKAFVTKDLKIVGAENNTYIAGTSVGFIHPQTANGTDKITGDDIPDEVASVRCEADYNWVEQAYSKNSISTDRANDFACAMFYTKKSVSKNAYTISSLKNGSAAYKSTVLKDHQDYSVIGNYVVEMPAESTDGGSCGEICIIAKGVQKLADYAKWNTEGSQDIFVPNVCVEIGRVSENPNPGITPVPETGAFASYALLVAGALIAIGAITIAKKNNRFNKI